jgi:hypothetical protein
MKPESFIIILSNIQMTDGKIYNSVQDVPKNQKD